MKFKRKIENLSSNLLGMLLFFGLFCIIGCQSVEQLSIDYMQPAEISFPESLQRVAIVNNVPNNSDIEPYFAPMGETGYYNGDAVIATESLAQAIAEQNYFQEVVVCDSSLRSMDIYPQEHILTQEETELLVNELDVDFLIALDKLQISAVRQIGYIPQLGVFYGSVNANVLPTIRVYLPNREKPIVTIHQPDSIYWEEMGTIPQVQAYLVKEKEMLTEASKLVGTIPIKKLVPNWKTASRYLYTGGSVDMRDAAIYAREEQWNKAIELWKQCYQNKKAKVRMQAAHNLALGYEMQDSIQVAIQWIEKAQEEAFLIDKVDASNLTESEMERYPHYFRSTMHATELEERNKEMVHLQTQMQRFQDDF